MVSVERPPSIADVARMAGVSVATVSRVMNGTRPVSQRRREDVTNAMHQLGFVPNRLARALKTGRSGSVAILASNTVLYGYSATMSGVEEASRAAELTTGITVMDAHTDRSAQESIDLLVGQGASGVIAIAYDPIVRDALKYVPSRIPIVAVSTAEGAGAGRHDALIQVEDEKGVLLATAHLVSLGHQTVEYVGQPSARRNGWRNALLANGCPVHEPIGGFGWDTDAAYRTGRQLVERKATAVMCQNDETAMAVMAALHDLGRKVPDDVSVIGVDDHPLSRFWRPSLSSVRLDFVDAGRRAGEALAGLIGGDAAPDAQSLEAEFVTRDSIGAPPAGHKKGRHPRRSGT